jgi:hypothetical protein
MKTVITFLSGTVVKKNTWLGIRLKFVVGLWPSIRREGRIRDRQEIDEIDGVGKDVIPKF